MRRATSLQTPPHPYAHARPTATVAVNGIARGAWCTRMVGTGGGIFALRRPRPYSRAFAGISLRGIAAPTTIYAHAGIYGKAERQITTRHAASLRPSRNGENRF